MYFMPELLLITCEVNQRGYLLFHCEEKGPWGVGGTYAVIGDEIN